MSRKHEENKKKSNIIFKSGTRIGFAAAEDDDDLLRDCYVNISQVSHAINVEDPGSIILGRTGSGKTAAIKHILNTENHVVEISPLELSLSYISNSTILRYFHDIGVDLDLFFQMLWRHVLCVEILNYHYNVRGRSDLDRLKGALWSAVGGDNNKKLAVSYLEEWGSEFWHETQERVREIITKFEGELNAAVSIGSEEIKGSIGGKDAISEQERTEIAFKAKRVVDKVQIQKLSNLMDILAEDILDPKKGTYYILIDKLDEQWVDDNLRYRLIRALIETIKAFRKVRSCKIIIALRQDLIERVYKYTRSSGFQEEKYRDMNVEMKWLKEDLKEVVDRRIQEVFRRQYTNQVVEFSDIFPEKYKGQKDTFEYLLERTQYRPRDIIAFINEIFNSSIGKSAVIARYIDDAETVYSKNRLSALCTEWADEHPYLEDILEMLRGLPTRFNVGMLKLQYLENTILKLCEHDVSPDQSCQKACAYMNSGIEYESIRKNLLAILYKVGAVGVKMHTNTAVEYVFSSAMTLTEGEIRNDVRVSISPMLWRALGNSRSRAK